MRKGLAIGMALVMVLMGLMVMAPSSAAEPGSMRGYWRFDTGIGSVAIDSSDAINDGILSGGKFGNALEFDGADDYVNFGNDPSLDICTAWTISMWVKWQSSSETYQTLFNKENPKTAEGWDIAYSAWIYSNQLYFGMNDADRTWYQDAQMGIIPEDTWTHIAVTFDGTDARSYINGAHTDTLSIGKTGWTNDANLLIGIRHTSAQRFTGRIDEMAIYSKALSASEISSYYASNDVHTSSLDMVALWHFDDSVGATAFDDSANSNDGTINGATWAGPIWTTGIFGDALSFDGIDDYVVVPHDTMLNPTSAITVECWAKLNHVTSHHALVRKLDTYVLKVAFLSGTGAKLEGWVKIGGVWKGVGWAVPGGTLLNADTWYHFAVTYDGAQMRTYVNGNLDRSAVVTGTIDSTTNPFNIGRRGPPETIGTEYTDGIIDEVRIWDKALTLCQIELAMSGKMEILPEAGLVIYDSAIHGLNEGDSPEICILADHDLTGIDYNPVRHVTPKKSTGWISNIVTLTDGYQVTVHKDDDNCKTIHLWVYLDTGEHIGVNLHFER